MKKAAKNLIAMFLALAAVGCADSGGFHAADVPREMAKPEDLEPLETNKQWSEEDFLSEFESSNPEEPVTETQEKSPVTRQKEPSPTDVATAEPQDSKTPATQKAPEVPAKSSVWKSVIDIAKWVIQNEGARVGNGCNFFIQRVFERLGIGKGSWVANGFDTYVKNTFPKYNVRSFHQTEVQANRANLKNYLWSHPERTGFVFQWKRKTGHGHVAFVQRIDNQLVIYHASLNKFRPKAQQVTVETLLSKSGDNNSLNVFSHFEK